MIPSRAFLILLFLKIQVPRSCYRSLSLLRFWHIALIVIVTMLQEKEFGRNEFGDNTDKNEKRKMRENLSENPLKIALE